MIKKNSFGHLRIKFQQKKILSTSQNHCPINADEYWSRKEKQKFSDPFNYHVKDREREGAKKIN